MLFGIWVVVLFTEVVHNSFWFLFSLISLFFFFNSTGYFTVYIVTPNNSIAATFRMTNEWIATLNHRKKLIILMTIIMTFIQVEGISGS